MKTALAILLIFTVLVCVYFAYLSATDKAPDVSLVGGELRPPPATPNCVSSETKGEKYIEPLRPAESISLDDFWEQTIYELSAMGGNIERQDSEFVWATFRSKIFKFTDDVELRKDTTSGVIQIRSSSRSGKSDLGVNRKRVEALRARIHTK